MPGSGNGEEGLAAGAKRGVSGPKALGRPLALFQEVRYHASVLTRKHVSVRICTQWP